MFMIRKSTKILPLYISTALILSSCSQYKGVLTGCATGITAGYLINEEKGAIVGGILGCTAGYLWDRRQVQISEIAKKNNTAVATETDQITVKISDTIENEAFIMSSSYARQEIFLKGSSKLSDHAKKLYEDLAATYIDENNKLLVIGHADSDGPASYNQKLSERRAKNVAKFLNEKGIETHRIYYEGAGESRPVSDNSTNEGKMLNRRVEIVEFKMSESATALEQEVIIAHYNQQIKSDQRNILKHQVNSKDTLSRTPSKTEKPTPNKSSIPTNQLDFGGKPANHYIDYSKVLGKPKKRLNFSLIPKAYAQESTPIISCINDFPKEKSTVKRLTDNTELAYSTTDYIPAMNESVWLEDVNGHLVSISPVAVLKDGLKAADNPTIKLYKSGYKETQQNKPNFTINTTVDLYDGENSFLMRIFSLDQTTPFDCIDVILPKSGETQATAGSIYYRSNNTNLQANYLPHRL